MSIITEDHGLVWARHRWQPGPLLPRQVTFSRPLTEASDEELQAALHESRDGRQDILLVCTCGEMRRQPVTP